MKKFLSLGVILLSLTCNYTYSQTYNPVVVYTPSGKAVNAGVLASSDLTSQQKLDSKNFWLQCYNNRITYINEATLKYNCHGYAWHITRPGGGSYVWMLKPEQKKYWQCGGYAEVSASIASKVSFGGPCYYYKTNCDGTSYADWCDHSAITTSTPGRFKSKWGPAPLFEHDIADCPYNTTDLHYYALITLAGPSPLCTTGSYTVNNLPSGTTINWSSSSNINRVSPPHSNPCTFGKYSNGNGYIYADLISGCETIYFSLPVHTGPYSSSDYPITGPSSAPCNTEVYYSIPQLVGVTSINWEWPQEWSYVSGQGTRYLALRTGLYAGVVLVGVNNTCGQSGSYAMKYTYVYGYCGYSFSVYPNPASSELNILFSDIDTTDLAAVNNLELEFDYEIRIYNQFQQLVFATKTRSMSYTISINNFPEGSYVLTILNKEGIIQRTVFTKTSR